MYTIQRVRATVALDDPEPALADAEAQARGGDREWRAWLDAYHDRRALVVRLEVWLEYETDAPGALHIHNRGVWLEPRAHPPMIEAQLAELVSKDFPLFAQQLRQRGVECDADALGDMYVHIELDDRLRRELAALAAADDRRDGQLPAADARLSRAHE